MHRPARVRSKPSMHTSQKVGSDFRQVCAEANRVRARYSFHTTRVGEGPLPTLIEGDYHEDFDRADELRETATTTGRQRRNPRGVDPHR